MLDPAAWHSLWQWITQNQTLLNLLAVASLVMFAGTIIVVPLIIVRLPHDYLSAPESKFLAHFPPYLRLPLTVLKNVIGVVLILAGIAMLVLPGQGILTIVIGLMLVQLPGKRRLIKTILGRPRVLRTINRLRRKARKRPMTMPPSE